MTKLNMINDSILSRREAFKKAGMGAASLALAGMGLGALANPAQAQLADANAGLVLACRTARLQAAFYTRAQGSALYTVTGFSATDKAIIDLLVQHKAGHATALTTILGSSAPAAIATNSYDLSGNGAWTVAGVPAFYSSRSDFLEAAQLLEDFGVRVQKAAIALMAGDTNLETMFRMHSASGMHASVIRNLKANSLTAGWITSVTDSAYGTGSTTPGSQGYLMQLTYGAVTPSGTISTTASTSEDNRIHGTTGASASSSQWFDEPIRITATDNDATAFLTEFDA